MIFSCFGTFRELAVLFRGTQNGINKGIVGTCNIIRELFNDKTVLDTINQVRLKFSVIIYLHLFDFAAYRSQFRWAALFMLVCNPTPPVSCIQDCHSYSVTLYFSLRAAKYSGSLRQRSSMA